MTELSATDACCSRRAVLAGLGAAALPIGAQAAPLVTVTRQGVIDIHHHIVPPFYKAGARPWLARTASNVADVLAWTPERSLAAMDAAGVETAVLSLSAPGFDFLHGAEARRMAQRCNDYAAQLQHDHAGRFRFFAALPMPDVSGAIDEAVRALDTLDAAGLGLLSNYSGRYLGDPAFAPLFEKAASRGAIIYVHPTSAQCCQGLVPGVLDPLLEFPVDTGRTISSLLWSGTFSRWSRLRFVFSHGAGILPVVAERISAAGLINRSLAARVPEGPRAALERLFVDTASVANRAGIGALDGTVPPEHILFGTDFPWGNLERSLSSLEHIGLPSARIEAIERLNARALLGLA